MKKEIITSLDILSSLYSKVHKDFYNSNNISIKDVKHIFIDCGLRNLAFKNKINILDIDFGTGLNALLTLNELKDKTISVNYIGIEPNPIEYSILKQLNFSKFFDFSNFDDLYEYIHLKPKNTPHYLTENFILNILDAKIQEIQFQDLVFDLVYFNPIKPKNQSEVLNEEEIFEKVYNSMSMGGILVTYNLSKNTQQTLKSVGFKIEKISESKSKNEVINAIKNIEVADCKSKCNSCSNNH